MAMKKLQVLVAEDDPGLRELVTELLTMWGHSVHAVGDGEEAARYLKHASETELVVTDFQMPRKNGIELTRDIKRVTPGIKVIVMSGFSSDLGILMEMVDVSGADAFIKKPFSIGELQATIASVSP